MNPDWLQEEDVLAFDDVEPYIPPSRQNLPLSAQDRLRHPPQNVADQYDLPPYWSRRSTTNEHPPAKPHDVKQVPCCTGAMRVSLQHYGRRVLCKSCRTIYRFGRPIGHAPVARFGPRH